MRLMTQISHSASCVSYAVFFLNEILRNPNKMKNDYFKNNMIFC